MNRTSLINHLVNQFGYKSYLEIGVRFGGNYNSINCQEKVGVDPSDAYHDATTYKMTSDEYFSKLPVDKKFDVIFIDGLHLEQQVDKDIKNSLDHLSDNGTIVIHDCSPETIHHARENYEDHSTPARFAWNGTVWKSFVKARCDLDGIEAFVVDIDCGCGIIRKNLQGKKFSEIPVEECLKWETFDTHRKTICNIITEQEFLNLNKS